MFCVSATLKKNTGIPSYAKVSLKGRGKKQIFSPLLRKGCTIKNPFQNLEGVEKF
jgi:hypothetical protein